MSIIYILLTISLGMASIFLGIFLWNLRNGQFDDDYTPSVRMLFEDADISSQLEVKKTGTTESVSSSASVPKSTVSIS